MKYIGTTMILLAIASVASAAEAAPVPEIDGSFLVSGMVLVSGALLIARTRRRK